MVTSTLKNLLWVLEPKKFKLNHFEKVKLTLHCKNKSHKYLIVLCLAGMISFLRLGSMTHKRYVLKL